MCLNVVLFAGDKDLFFLMRGRWRLSRRSCCSTRTSLLADTCFCRKKLGLERNDAIAVADRLCGAVAAMLPGGQAVTAIPGVASGVTALNDLLARAAACLYAARGAGRNRVVCSDCLQALKQETTA